MLYYLENEHHVFEDRRYYVEPSIAMKMSSLNGINNSSQNNSTSSAASHPVSTTNMPSTSIIKAKSEVFVVPPPKENNNTRLYMNGNGLDKSTKPVTVVDPFQPTNQTQPSFANFDNAPIFTATSTIPGTGSLMSAPLSVGPTVPTEDRYAALKDLDSQMKSQFAMSTSVPVPQHVQQEPSHHPHHHQPPPNSSSDPWGSPGALVGSPPVANGLWTPTPAPLPPRPKEPATAATLNGFSSNPFANDNWICENGITNGTNGEASKNPFKSSKVFSDWPGTNGSSEATVNQSFGTFQWIPNNHANPFSVGSFSGSPGANSVYHSSNPFL